ncbi:MAG: cytochrome c [Cyanobacteria bacterium TGS_CYA1]|nr:cytochrome c [Cyanobacteria bacterium TGS_CYA1]
MKLSIGIIIGCTILLATPDQAQAKPFDGATELEKQGCMHCHSLDGEGGMIGPPFDNIKEFRSKQFIQNKLSKPVKHTKKSHSYPVPSDLMNHVYLKEETALKIADYLINYKSKSTWQAKGHGNIDKDEVPLGAGFNPHVATKESRLGQALYRDKGCAACHSINMIGGRLGPSLDGVGARRSKKFIENRITTGATVTYGDKEYKPSEYIMPSMKLSQKEVRMLTEFLLTLPVKNKE